MCLGTEEFDAADKKGVNKSASHECETKRVPRMDSLRPFLEIKPALPDNGPDYETQGMLLSWQPSMN